MRVYVLYVFETILQEWPIHGIIPQDIGCARRLQELYKRSLPAGVAELADALDLGSSGFNRGSSSLPVRTMNDHECGSSSVVEHHLAKVGVAGSNPVFRSI
jgi:hypothetical protein